MNYLKKILTLNPINKTSSKLLNISKKKLTNYTDDFNQVINNNIIQLRQKVK